MKLFLYRFNYLLATLLVLACLPYKAQQNALFNTYVYDPFQLNVAYAGHGCAEINLHYRDQWIGLKDSPKFFQVNAHTALGKSNGIGLRFVSQQVGLLNSTQAMLAYAYRFKVSSTADVHLGIGAGWTQSMLNAQRAVVIDANDASLGNATRQKANGFDNEFGAMYIGYRLKAGISVSHLYNTNPSFAGNSSYKLQPQPNASVSYVFNKDKKIEIEPWLVDRYTLNGTNVVEGMLNVHFLKAITAGAGYRSNYGLIGFIGAKVGPLKIAYSFDYGTSRHATATGSSHQVMLGLAFCKTAKNKAPVAEKEPVAATPTVALVPEPVIAKEPVTIKEEPVKEEPVKEEPKAEPEKEDILAKMNKVAEEVIFDLNQSQLDEKRLQKLDEIAALVKKDPALVVNIIGHTCNLGTAERNSQLSVQRADYVRRELIRRGVNPKSIRLSKGVGAEDALFDNNSENQRKNRTIRFESSTAR